MVAGAWRTTVRGALVAVVMAAKATFATAASVCPGDGDGDGTVSAAELEDKIHAVFSHGARAAFADTEETVAALVEVIAVAGLQRPVCAVGVKGQWRSMPPLSEGPRQEVGVALAGNEIFVIGGIGPAAVGLPTVEAFDPATLEWRPVAPLPRALHHVAAAGDNEWVYVAGGYEGTTFRPVSFVFRYNPRANAWENLPPLPVAVGAAAAAVVNGELHVVGGGRGIQSVNEHQVLDLSTLHWRAAAALPEALNHLVAVVREGQLYVLGGRRDPAGLQNSASLYRYDSQQNRWEELMPMPTARSGHAAAVVGSWLVVFGGEVYVTGAEQRAYPHVELYNFEQNAWWSDRAMAVPRHGFGAVSVGNTVYLPGGAIRAGYGATAWHDQWELLSE